MKEKLNSLFSTIKKKPKIILIIISIIFIVLGIICIGKAFDLKNNYYMSSSYSTLNKHVYVGGDAYNYIINANYFTGYIALGSACFICSTLLIATNLLLKNSNERN